MQQSSIAPEVKAALGRCFAAHKALRSYSAEVELTAEGLSSAQSGRVRVALERPGRLRLETTGADKKTGTGLVVGTNGYVYTTDLATRSYRAEQVPTTGDVLVVGIENATMFLLPLFSQLFSEPKGLEACLEMFKTLTLQPGTMTFTAAGTETFVLRFDPTDLLLREVSLTLSPEKGTKGLLREVYKNVRANPTLPASLWRFAPPAGFRDEDGPPELLPPAPRLGKGEVTTVSGLRYVDVVVGKGTVAAAGTTVTFHYSSALTNGRPAGSSRTGNLGKPLSFRVPGQVLPALNEAVLGMRPGGRRKLVVPPALAFGEHGAGKVVPPNATLILEIEMLDVKELRG